MFIRVTLQGSTAKSIFSHGVSYIKAENDKIHFFDYEKWSKVEYERGYFRSISSGRDFQFFSAHFFSESRTDTRVGAFDRYTLPKDGKIIEKSCNIFKKIFRCT